MTEAYDGRQVVGIDLHRRRSVIVRMTEDGRKLGTARITSSPAALRAEITKAGENPRVVVEATYGWYWAADVLEEAGAEVHLAHPLGVKAYSYRRVKNDERDAADLADLLRMGRLPEAWIAPPEIRELRELTRYRHQLVKARTSLKDQVHGVLAKLGIPVTCTDIFGAWGNTWLDGVDLPQPYGGKVASLRQLAGELSAEITLLDTVEFSKTTADFHRGLDFVNNGLRATVAGRKQLITLFEQLDILGKMYTSKSVDIIEFFGLLGELARIMDRITVFYGREVAPIVNGIDDITGTLAAHPDRIGEALQNLGQTLNIVGPMLSGNGVVFDQHNRLVPGQDLCLPNIMRNC